MSKPISTAPAPPAKPVQPPAPKFAVLIFCTSEADQRTLYQRFAQERRKCRLLAL